jgi:hypothetical protein
MSKSTAPAAIPSDASREKDPQDASYDPEYAPQPTETEALAYFQRTYTDSGPHASTIHPCTERVKKCNCWNLQQL